MRTIDERKCQNRLVVVLFLYLQLKLGRSKILEGRQSLKDGISVLERDVVCTSDQMVVNLSFMEPFDGMVYAQNHYQVSFLDFLRFFFRTQSANGQETAVGTYSP